MLSMHDEFFDSLYRRQTRVHGRQTVDGWLTQYCKALVERDEQAGKQVTELSLDCDAELPDDLDVDTPAACKALTAKCGKLQFEPALD